MEHSKLEIAPSECYYQFNMHVQDMFVASIQLSVPAVLSIWQQYQFPMLVQLIKDLKLEHLVTEELDSFDEFDEDSPIEEIQQWLCKVEKKIYKNRKPFLH